MRHLWVQVIVAMGQVISCGAGLWSFPGVAPRSFAVGDKVPLIAHKVTSTKTQIPYLYSSLPFCKPRKVGAEHREMGDHLIAGDAESLYDLAMGVDASCVVACTYSQSKADAKLLRSLIDDDYRISWYNFSPRRLRGLRNTRYIDSLPAAVRSEDVDYVDRGFPVGFVSLSREHFVHNHVRLVVSYHEDPAAFSGRRVVGFEVLPASIRHAYHPREPLRGCAPGLALDVMSEDPQRVEAEGGAIVYSYDVRWVASDTPWASRWDVYLRGDPHDEIHYFSIVNSLMVVVVLTGVVAAIMLRTLRHDISTYNDVALASMEEAVEEYGWKLLHGDAVRPPRTAPTLLAVLAGTGCQVLAMCLVTVAGCLLGGLGWPEFHRNNNSTTGLVTVLLGAFVACGSVNGFATAQVYKLLVGGGGGGGGAQGGPAGKQGRRKSESSSSSWGVMALAATLFPGVCLFIVAVLEVLSAHYFKEAAAEKLDAAVVVVALWAGVSAPLVALGFHVGYDRCGTIQVPTRVSQVPRTIPAQPCAGHPLVTIALGGLFPFGAVCVELFFVMSALWLHHLYYVVGFASAVLVILVATCAELTVVLVYLQLGHEDYRWWWRSFLTAGSSAGYLLAYSIWYYFSKLHIQPGLPTAVYFGNMLVLSLAFFVLCGSVGFFASLAFVLKIYSAIKVD